MRPILLLGMIPAGMVGIGTLALFNAGLRAPAAPGSIIAVFAQTPGGSFVGVALSVTLAAATSFVLCSLLLRMTRRRAPAGGMDLAAATAEMEALKGRKSSVASALTGVDPSVQAQLDAAEMAEEEHEAITHRTPIHHIVFACDAGMGSSAMGASVLRNKIKKAGFADVTVTNLAIANLTDDIDLIVTHKDLTPRAQSMSPSAQHVSVENFMNSPKYDQIVEELKVTNAHGATSSN